jgi:hypothetical protein
VVSGAKRAGRRGAGLPVSWCDNGSRAEKWKDFWRDKIQVKREGTSKALVSGRGEAGEDKVFNEGNMPGRRMILG